MRSWGASAGVEDATVFRGEVETASSEMRVLGLGMVGRVTGDCWKEFLSMPGVRTVSNVSAS